MPQALEGGEVAIGESVAVAIDAVDGDDARAVAVVADDAATGQHVQDALFDPGNVQD